MEYITLLEEEGVAMALPSNALAKAGSWRNLFLEPQLINISD